MKRYIICFGAILFLIAPVFAGFNIEAIGGYSNVSMNNLNNNIDQIFEKAKSDPSVSYVSVEHVENGWYIGIDGGYSFMPGLSIGPRFEYLGTFDAQIKMNSSSFPLTITSAIADLTVSLIPLMAGISYAYTIPGSPFSFSAEIYGGYGFGNLSIDTTMENSYLAAATVETFEGACFVLDSALKFSYSFNSIFSAGLNVGYMLANVTKLRYTRVGFTLPNISDYSKDLQLDFSGLKIGAALNFSI